MFTSHLNKPLTIDLYFIRYHPCAFLACHLIAALIKNQVCATLGLWEKAVESHQPILINIEKRGFACLSQSDYITDPKFSNFEFVRVNAFHLFTNRFRAHSSRSRTRIARTIRRLAFVPPYSVFCSISFRCGGLSIERNQKPLTPENTLAITHHDRQKQVEVKRSSRVNPHEIRLFSGCPYYFTLPMNGNYHSFPKHLRQPCKEGRSFGVDMHHIISSKCTIKCCEKGRAYRRKSP